MKELISKNPIQRFKQGKKLIKAQGGVKTSSPNETIGRYVREKNRSLFGSGWRWYDTQAPVGRDHVALNQEIEQNGWILKPDGTKIRASLRNRQHSTIPTKNKAQKNNSNLQTIKGEELPEVTVVSQVSKNGKSNPTGKRTTIKRVSTLTSIPVNYGLVGGVQKGWKGQRGFIDDQSFADLQSLGYSGERNAQTAQQWMNDNLSKYLVPGAVAVDNAWGEQSSRALKMMMQNKANQDQASIFTQNPILFNSLNSTDEQATLNVGNNPDLKLTPTKFNFNKAQTRDWLRNNGIGPYSLTGAQRHAVRNVLGGNGTDQDRSLIGTNSKLLELLTKRGYFKQGGLISRNPVQRFKNNINKN